MTEELKQIASRIKVTREIAGISAQEAANNIELPIERYLEIEQGAQDIPLSLLYKLAHLFKIDLSTLIVGENPRLHVYCIDRKGHGVSVERRKNYKYDSLAFNFINKKAEPFIVTVDPSIEAVAPAFNSHPGQEFNYVLEGTLKIIIDSHEIILNEGDSVYFDSNYKHTMMAANLKPVRLLAMIL